MLRADFPERLIGSRSFCLRDYGRFHLRRRHLLQSRSLPQSVPVSRRTSPSMVFFAGLSRWPWFVLPPPPTPRTPIQCLGPGFLEKKGPCQGRPLNAAPCWPRRGGRQMSGRLSRSVGMGRYRLPRDNAALARQELTCPAKLVFVSRRPGRGGRPRGHRRHSP